MKNNQSYTGLEVAVIGMACRFPGASNYATFWNNLINGVESVRFFSVQELIDRGVKKETIENERFIPAICIPENKDHFDASLFGYTPEEAALMHPVNRIFHECVWEALEDAGYDPFRTDQVISLYAGTGEEINWSIYSALKNHRKKEIDEFSQLHISSRDHMTTLISYKLNLKGPSFSVHTACSTSLVAINLAIKSLLLGEATMALAGGASIATAKHSGYINEEGLIYSADGHCRAFDEQASGTVVGEGAGVVVLKRLNDAIRDRDNIYCIIKGGAINNDGARKVGFPAPSVEGQAACIRRAQKFAKVEPESISYVEAHGTGTRVGDPIEIMALNEAFGKKGDRKYCAIGTLKSNVGHLDAASGVAGLIKTALCLQNRLIPASINFTAPNPEIDFKNGPFYVNTSLKAWQPEDGMPRRAGISSFGVGGTNAHVIVEEAPASEPGSEGRITKILSLSAKTKDSLYRYMNSLKEFLEREPKVNADDMAYTLHTGRHPFAYRRSLTFDSVKGLTELLGGTKEAVHYSKDRNSPVVFMFPGQGIQYAGMGKGLYQQEALFREEMDKGFAILEKLTGEDLRAVLFAEDGGEITGSRYLQPLVFLLEYALARLLIRYGIKPAYMIGHSLGEYVAACIGGAFSLEEGLRLVKRRNELMHELPAGEMIAVLMREAEAREYIRDGISLASVNAPDRVVFSGGMPALAALKDQLQKQGVTYAKLNTSHAFHSEMMAGAVEAFREELRTIKFQKPEYPLVSNSSGRLINGNELADPEYWIEHMLGTVNFSQGIATLLNEGKEFVFIEVGPGNTLSTFLRQQRAGNVKPIAVNVLRSLSDAAEEGQYLAGAIGRLWELGLDVDWSAYYEGQKRRRVSLPTYSFEPVSYPAEVDPLSGDLFLAENLRSVLTGGGELKDWLYYPGWKRWVPALPEKEMAARGFLIFSSGDAPCNVLLPELCRGNDRMIAIRAGKSYSRSGDSYIIDAESTNDYERLLKEVSEDGFTITDIVYCWGMDKEREEELGYLNLVFLIQGLLKRQAPEGLKIDIITNQLHKVTGNESSGCGQSLLLGLVTVLPQEHAIRCRNIDISFEEMDERSTTALQEEVRRESEQRIVALRYGQRWIPDFQNNTQEIIPAAKDDIIRPNAQYLITGGLGNVGFLLAKHLIEAHGAKVVITGRGDIDGDARYAAKKQRFLQLKEMDGDTTYFRVDVADTESMRQAVNEVERKFGAIRGVIHTAGDLDAGLFELIEDLTSTRARAMFTPKVKGIRVLYEIFKNKGLDFLWATSSLASVVGGVGYSAYAAANAYMENFILSRASELPGWKCVGLAELMFTEGAIGKGRGADAEALKPEDLTTLFEWSLRLRDTPVMLQTVKPLALRLKELEAMARHLPVSGTPEAASESIAERPQLSNSYVAPETATEKRLAEMIGDVFGIRGIGAEDSFLELGGDSLKAMRFLKRIEKEFGVALELKAMFNNDTVKKIAGEIDEVIWISKDSGAKKFISTI